MREGHVGLLAFSCSRMARLTVDRYVLQPGITVFKGRIRKGASASGEVSREKTGTWLTDG